MGRNACFRGAIIETPWTTCRFEPSPEFARFERYFEWYADRTEHDDELGRLLTEVKEKGGYRLVSVPAGETSLNPGLHIDGEYATFR